MSQLRTELQIRADMQAETSRLKDAEAEGADENVKRGHVARLQEFQRELRALDDTPVIPFRPSSVPPSVPRGRPSSCPIAIPGLRRPRT